MLRDFCGCHRRWYSFHWPSIYLSNYLSIYLPTYLPTYLPLRALSLGTQHSGCRQDMGGWSGSRPRGGPRGQPESTVRRVPIPAPNFQAIPVKWVEQRWIVLLSPSQTTDSWANVMLSLFEDTNFGVICYASKDSWNNYFVIYVSFNP